MSEVFDERRRALEEDYFRRKDKESLERLRAALKAEAEARGEASAHEMRCPRCNGTLKEESFDEVHIDRCDNCHGIWLDAGELEQLSRQETPRGRWMSIFWPGSGGSRGDENR
ncbi:MAG TPA: zf-TFIIB domain-containing protein [Pyrinomonadaceae bacterium]|nr:zf-TFIIB domain-containing protein [Pyrinomonadaceae bacterium]